MKRLLVLVLVGLVAFGLGVGRLDPDYGWHVRMGELIYQTGIPLTDPFSYTMPRFPVVSHEWLWDLTIYVIENYFGVIGVSVFMAILMTATVWFVLDIEKKYYLIPLLFGSIAWLARGGNRPQILDWLFFAILLWLFWLEKRWVKWRWMWPIVMIIWVNLHGGFAVGIAGLLVMTLMRAWQNKRFDWGDLWVWGLSILSTAINPYGMRLWWELWLTMSDSSLKWTIAEWVPFFLNFEMGFWILCTFVAMLLSKLWREVLVWKVFVCVGVVAASATAVRHAGIAVVFLVPFAAELIRRMHDGLVNSEEQEKRWGLMYKILIGVAVVMLGWDLGVGGYLAVKKSFDNFYPQKAVQYLNSNTVLGNLFSEYGWGGYLIRNIPGRKLFIDGRMPSWRYEKQEKCEDSCWAMKDYQKITKGEYEDLFYKYDVRTVLWPRSGELRLVKIDSVERFLNKIAKVFGQEREVKKDLGTRLLEDGWVVEYEDEVARILVRR